MDNRYYVCIDSIGIDRFDISNDQMTSIVGSKEKSRWIKFNLEDAKEVARHTGWEIVEVDKS